jgi:biopolymer transport protein ExbD
MTHNHSHRKISRAATLALSTRPFKLRQDPATNSDGEVRIEIVPMIDVIFCILVFFILAAVTFSRQQAINIDLPKAQSGLAQKPEMLIVSLDEMGQVYVEQQLVTKNQLAQALQNYRQFNPNGRMVLYAPRNATYNEVIQVLDTLKQIGGDRVALATLPGESGLPQDATNPAFPNNQLPSGNNFPGGSFNTLPQNPPSNVNPGLGNSQFNPYAPALPAPPTSNTTPGNSQR